MNFYIKIAYFNRELQLARNLSDEQIVQKRFSSFHNPYNRSVHLVLSILEDFLVSHLVLFLSFFQLD